DRMIARRTFLIFLGVGALSPARSLFAQQPGKIKRIGLLLGGSRESSGTMPTEEFLRGLRDLGYVEGKDFVVEWRTADNRYDRFPALAADLVNVNVDVIVTSGTPGVAAARRATKTIPIVAVSFGDPVGDGFAASLSRPGGNVTGLTTMGVDLYAKRLEILLAVAPKVTRVGILVNPDNAFLNEMVGRLRADAQKDGRDLLALNIRAASELEGAFSQMTRQRAGGVIVADETVLNPQSQRIADLALRHKLPSIFAIREGAAAGGLMSYGADFGERARRAAAFVDKIFKGTKAGDIPIEQPTKFELAINMKTARALGLTIPQDLAVRADRVIE